MSPYLLISDPKCFSVFYSDNSLKLTNQVNALNRILASTVYIWMTGTNESQPHSFGMAITEASLVLQHLGCWLNENSRLGQTLRSERPVLG